MASVPKVVGLMSCGFLLCLGLSSVAQSEGDPGVRKGGQAGVRGDQGKLKRGHKIEGEVLRIDGEYYFVTGQDKMEVRLHTDRTTKKTGNISQGDRIVANVNDKNHAQSIRAADMADMTGRRPDNADRTTDSTGMAGMMEQ